LPYIGRAFEPASRNAYRRDNRDGTNAELLETGIPGSQLRAREQEYINQHGGVRRTDNARNEIRPGNWSNHGIGPPN